MLALVLLAILAVILFGAGFAIHVLWWVAIAAAVVWLVSFFMRPHAGRRVL